MPKSVFSDRYRRFLKMLVEARTEARVTQVQLAEKIGWTQSDVSKAERGELRLDVAEFLQIAEALKIDAVEFVRRLQGKKR